MKNDNQNPTAARPIRILPLIVLSQFAGTSLWFAGNAVLPDLSEYFLGTERALSGITSSVQLGFIAGTLFFAWTAIADRFSPSRVFFVSSLLAATANAAITWITPNIQALYVLRFACGFFLAGIYPVGMKIAADWYAEGLGKALGLLVGALVLGTAFPHLLKDNTWHLPWQAVLRYTSLFALTGGLLILFFVPDGPHRKKMISTKTISQVRLFQNRAFLRAAGGYFGHMWELYTVWAFIPLLLQLYAENHQENINIPAWSFLIIASGAVSCMGGGLLSIRKGSARVALYALYLSGTCCLLLPFFMQVPFWIFILFLFTWGISVVADSPQLSSLVATYANPEQKGTALSLATSIGFAITIPSIYLADWSFETARHSPFVFWILIPGPVLGIICLNRLLKGSR